MSSSTGGGGDGKQPASQHTIPPPKTSGAATGGQQLSASANQFVDKIDPFSKRGNSRRRRRLVGSSRYHTDNEPDLVQLQMLKDAPQAEQTGLAIQKLQQCQKIFDFYDPVSQLKSKEVLMIDEKEDEDETMKKKMRMMKKKMRMMKKKMRMMKKKMRNDDEDGG